MWIKKHWTAALTTAVAVAALTASTGHADTAPTTIFGGFESADSVSAVKVSTPDQDSVRWSSDVTSSGTHSLEFDVGAGTGTAQIDLPSGTAFDADSWTGHEILSWDVMSNSPVQYLGRVTFKDSAGHAWGHAYYVPPFGLHPYDGYVSDVAKGGVDVSHIGEIDLSVPRQQWPVKIWFDSMRLVDQYPYDHTPYTNAATPGLIQQMQLGPRIDAQSTALSTAEKTIPDTNTAADDALRSQATQIAGTLATMKQQASRSDLDLATAQALNQQLQTVTGNVQRLVGVIAARRAQPGNPQYGVVAADSTTLIYPNDRPCNCTTSPAEIRLARGEYQSEQIAVIPYAQSLSGVQMRVAAVSGTPGALTVSADPVGFLDTTPSSAYNATKDQSGWYTGWTPDPIRTDLKTVDVPANAYQPYYLTVKAGASAPAGRYEITLQISGANVHRSTIVLTADVWPFTVADRPDLATSFEFNPAVPTQLYGDDSHTKQYEDFLESYKMEPGNIYAATPPTVDELEYIKNRWGLRHFNVLYLNYTKVNLNDPSTWPALINSWVSTISTAMEQYKAAGLDKYAYVYGFDESNSAYFPVMKQALGAIKQKYPDLPIMSTVRDNTMGPGSGLTGLVNVWAPQMDLYQAGSAATAHARGDQVYWYPDIATGHPYPNWFNGYPPIDTRIMMGPLSHQSGVDGVLYYNTDRWINHPLLTDGVYSNWDPATFSTTAGDGSLFYPGKDGPLPSIRLANFRDGMQDYNMLDLLAQRITHAQHASPSEIAHAKALLGAQAVVRSDTDYTEDPGTYRNWRAQVADEIVRLR